MKSYSKNQLVELKETPCRYRTIENEQKTTNLNITFVFYIFSKVYQIYDSRIKHPN